MVRTCLAYRDFEYSAANAGGFYCPAAALSHFFHMEISGWEMNWVQTPAEIMKIEILPNIHMAKHNSRTIINSG